MNLESNYKNIDKSKTKSQYKQLSRVLTNESQALEFTSLRPCDLANFTKEYEKEHFVMKFYALVLILFSI